VWRLHNQGFSAYYLGRWAGVAVPALVGYVFEKDYVYELRTVVHPVSDDQVAAHRLE
jgi:hypothetical protein